MAEQLTKQQEMVVNDRGGSLLVSAAAGSGKTKVLVDRLLRYVMDPIDPANLDEFLIITYTKAAASELRGKIVSKLSEMIALNPGNRHLQQQMQRVYLTKISTVHAFCSDILKEYAYQLDISSDFRMAEETECQQMQTVLLEQILDQAYEQIAQLPDLQAFVDTQGLGRDDRQIPEIILKVYNSARCHLDPQRWLYSCMDMSDTSALTDAGQTPWGAYLISDLHKCAAMHIDALERCIKRLSMTDGMESVCNLLNEDLLTLRTLCNSSSWEFLHGMHKLQWARFPSKVSDKELAEKVKAVRNACKTDINAKLLAFGDNTQQVLKDLASCAASARGLVYLVQQFSDAYDKTKKAKKVMDFSDLEQKMLDLLWGKNRDHLTTAAREVSCRFRQIMVDEYQDSNEVQDAIFCALTQQKNNCFMVGDVKQSIYQFRLADPTIFLDKYNSYIDAQQAAPGQPRRIMLSHNFRSAGSVIHAVNDVFSQCMSPEVGGLIYGENEMLYEGIPHEPQCEPEVELHALQVAEDTYAEEAAFVANRIRQLLDGSHTVRTKDGFRPIVPDDIVILLRSPGSVGLEYCYALEDQGISCTMGGGEDLMESEEIGCLYALLQTISNPLQDIPLVATLASRIFCFSADELAKIRGDKKYIAYYDSLKNSELEKVKQFLSLLSDFRHQARMCSITQLIEYIFAKTSLDSIFAAMQDGKKRTANIQEFCRIASACEANGRLELEQFLEHLDALARKGMVITSDQKPAGTVTVMSIHKSKGLEFPVVFLCGLSRRFNHRSASEQVLCDKDLGFGLACVDAKERVRYPSIAKKAISLKIKSEGISEEMRVLYVAMTRAKDRLIMTYAYQYLKSSLTDIALRTDLSSSELMAYDVGHPGKWILQSAMLRTEAGQLHAIGGHPEQCSVRDDPWLIQTHDVTLQSPEDMQESCVKSVQTLPPDVERIKKYFGFQYAHSLATEAPSKQTATQLKGRFKDQEVAANCANRYFEHRYRKPSFVEQTMDAVTYGTQMHKLMEHIDFSRCGTTHEVICQIDLLAGLGYWDPQLDKQIAARQIVDFFKTEIGQKLSCAKNVLREFKFSILEDADKYISGLEGEKILLQGVVDCAILEPDGITILDFKTDKVTDATVNRSVLEYTPQLTAYADALSRIYQKPIKAAYLYFFKLQHLAQVL